ncbi:MAG: ATP-dependent DNA helicase [Terriglobales bacterium]
MDPPERSGLYQFFGRGGLLEKAHAGYELRRGQLDMAQEVEAALSERRHLLIEAGTGTGKTLAYLLPVLRSGRRVLISTGTRNLQEQLVRNDIPLLSRALARELKVVAAKGRQNYACKHKIRNWEAQPVLMELDELDQYRQIRAWAETSETGDRAELDFLPEDAALWPRLSARKETCTGSKCPLYEECFLTRLRENASSADLVVVNHALFFADLVLKGQDLPGVLPPYEAVVFDEAHELEAAAANYFGVGVSSQQIEELARDTGLALRSARAGTPEMEQRIERFRTTGQMLFLALARGDARAQLERREEFLADHADVYDGYMHALGFLQQGLEAIVDKPEEIIACSQRLGTMRNQIAYILESEEEGVVYWVERRGRAVFLRASTIQVAEHIRELLFETTDTVILTSATLAVGESFAYVRERLGVAHARECVVASPFEWERQALLYVAGHLPEPNDAGFTAAAGEEILKLVEASRGRAFVLCTSVRQMQAYGRLLEGRMPFPLLVQGSEPRHLLLERFRATAGAVLVATTSFWQGVDVPGEQLSLVIIDRLPFAPPNDPVVAARIAMMKREGRNPFAEFQVPEAVLALKQGFGRLIRSRRDRGVLALLDARIGKRPYGKTFLDSLPTIPRTGAFADVVEFFAERVGASAPRG